jgi:hypothetical protein
MALGRRYRGLAKVTSFASLTLALALTVLPAKVAASAVELVTNCQDSGSGSLRAALANAISGETINFDLSCPAGTTAFPIIQITTPLTISTNLTVDGPGPSHLWVEDSAPGVFSVSSGVTTTISGIGISAGSGGQSATPASTQTTGGGILNEGTLSLSNVLFQDISVSGAGGAIYNTGTLTVTGSTLAGNGATDGGGIYNAGGSVTVDGTTFLANTASGNGAGIYNSSNAMSTGSVSITDSTIENNISDADGGGIYNTNPSSLRMINSTVSGSNANQGAGIDNLGMANITDDTLSGNDGYNAGGGIYNTGSLSLSDSTVADDQGSTGSGVYNGGGTISATSDTVSNIGTSINNAAGTLSYAGSIVAGGAPDCMGAITDRLYNLDDDGSCGFTALLDHSHTSAGFDAAGLEDHGGPTQTIALLPGSAAIGVVSSVSLCSVPDQRGLARPNPCDIGAFQTNPNGLSQIISFTSTPPTDAVVAGPSYLVTATASSGLPVSISIDPASTSVCLLDEEVIYFRSVGTCTIRANQGGNLTYNPAPQAQEVIAVGKGSQIVAFLTSPPSDPLVGGPLYQARAYSTGDAPPVITVDSSAASVCAIMPGAMSGDANIAFDAAGTCVLDANQAGDSNYQPAAQVQQSFTVYQQSPPPPPPSPPAIASIAPHAGKIGKKITISGSNLQDATSVSFNGTDAEILSDTTTEISTTVPKGAKSGMIRVTTSSGTATSIRLFRVRH